MIVAASRMPSYLQSLQRCPVQNREIKFYKGFFSKRKKYQILSIKKENIIWNDFPQQYINVNAFFCLFVFSSHAKYTCIYNT